jgi:hypothetical protein
MALLTCPEAATDLGKCCEFEYILLGDLRDLLEDQPSDENRRWLLAVLEALLDTLPKEFALKARDGYLQHVLDEFPSWDNAVERLERQHVNLYRRLRMLRDRIVTRYPLEEVADQLRRDLEAWMDAFTDLHYAERLLVFEAVNMEVGTGD